MERHVPLCNGTGRDADLAKCWSGGWGARRRSEMGRLPERSVLRVGRRHPTEARGDTQNGPPGQMSRAEDRAARVAAVCDLLLFALYVRVQERSCLVYDAARVLDRH